MKVEATTLSIKLPPHKLSTNFRLNIILKDLEAKACNVVQSGNDKKWEELSTLLQDTPEMFTPAGSRRKLIIFTEHRDTLTYLLDRITGLLGKQEAVVTIHGGTNRDERRNIQNLGWRNAQPRIRPL